MKVSRKYMNIWIKLTDTRYILQKNFGHYESKMWIYDTVTKKTEQLIITPTSEGDFDYKTVADAVVDRYNYENLKYAKEVFEFLVYDHIKVNSV